jgi:hypothetical protein
MEPGFQVPTGHI